MPTKPKESKIPTKKVKLEAFAMHGHVNDAPVDYELLFRTIAAMDPATRFERLGDRINALPLFTVDGTRYTFAAHTGHADASFLVYDLREATEEERALEPGKIVVRKTTGLIDSSKRVAVVQFVQHGAQAGQIARLIEELARRASPERFERLSLDFVPVPAEEFLLVLNRYHEIKSARIRFTRPNYDWEDYGETFQTLGTESGASGLEVAASAPRNGSLNRESGLIYILKKAVSSSTSMIKSAIVTGRKDDDSVITTLNLNKHIQTKQAEVPVTGSGQPIESEVQKLASQLLDSTPGSTE